MIIIQVMVTVARLHMGQMFATTHMTATITMVPFRTHASCLPVTSFVSSVATLATKPLNAILTTQACQPGPSFLSGGTNIWSSLKLEKSYAFGTMPGETALIPAPHMLNIAAHSVLMPDNWNAAVPTIDHASILYRITTPYNSDGWR